MEGKAVVLALHFEFKGDFDKIYKFIESKQDITPIYNKWEKRINREINNYAWFYDDEYPKDLMKYARPPFIVLKKNVKVYKFRFVSYTDVEVTGATFSSAKACAYQEFLNTGPDFEQTKMIHKRK